MEARDAVRLGSRLVGELCIARDSVSKRFNSSSDLDFKDIAAFDAKPLHPNFDVRFSATFNYLCEHIPLNVMQLVSILIATSTVFRVWRQGR